MSNFIPLSIPNLGKEESENVLKVVQDGWVSSVGPEIEKFEQKIIDYTGAKYAVACMNGTAAIHISLILCGIKAGDEVLAPNLTFIAPLNAIKYIGAHPILVDSEWKSLGMCPEKLQVFINEGCRFKDGKLFNKNTNRCIKAIIPMHTMGHPLNIEKIIEISKKYNLKVIEDASESLGSFYKNKHTGTFGDVGCISFNGNKIITTGGGGMIITNDERMAKNAKHLTTTAKCDPIEYDHDEVGFNYRLVNVLAAIGTQQMEKLETFVKIKNQNFKLYQELLLKNPLFELHSEPENTVSNYWMYTLIIKKNIDLKPMDIVKCLQQDKIQARPVWKLMEDLPMFKECCKTKTDVSRDIFNRCLSIPCSTSLTPDKIRKVTDSLNSLAKKYHSK